MEPLYEFSTIPATFQRVAAANAHKHAAIYLGSGYTYARLAEMASRFASGLQKMGIRPGDRVMIYLPNSLQWVVAWLGIQAAGAVAVPITPIYTPLDVDYIASDTQAKAIVCQDRNYGYVARIQEKTALEQVIVCGMVDLLPAVKRWFGWAFDKVPKGKAKAKGKAVWIKEVMAMGDGAPQGVPEDPDGTAEIIYTGGTTKHPKGVPISHRQLLLCAHEQITCCASLFKPQDNVVLGSAPLFHILGQTTGLGTILVHGGTLVIQPRVNLDAMMDATQRHRCTTLVGVPTLYRMILEHDRLDLYDLSSLVYCFSGGDVMPPDVQARWQQRFGRPIYIGYGASETVGGISMTYPDAVNPPPGAMGTALPSKDILIVDPMNLSPQPVGEPGEMLVHSDPMVEAYWNKPEETASAFITINGKRYYRTADVVRMDERGYLYFVDRTVDTIKHKGYRVSASEIECILQDHQAVISCCVVGIPDEKVGERIKAFVVLKKDVKGITGYDLISYCKGKLANYKIPQYIEFRDMLPKSKVGKLLRREVREEERKRLE